jgi:Tol biopolymer transport system component
MQRLVGLAAVLAATLVVAAGCGSSAAPRPDLAFVSSRDGAYQVYGMSSDGSHQRRLTHEQGDPATPDGLLYQIEPSWSPDGRSIAFASKRDGDVHLFVMGADGSGTRRLTSTRRDDENPSWSPDGARIAFDRDRHLFTMSADGTQARRVDDDSAAETDPAWSPDGRWLAYVRQVPQSRVREIWLIHPDGTGGHALTRLEASSESPAWSPDGRRIAFSSDVDGGATAIYVVGLQGAAPKRLTRSPEDAFEPAWSLDGKSVAFWSAGAIVAATLDGTETQLTSPDGNDSSPAWRPSASTASG